MNNTLNSFLNKKKAESPYLSLKNGESAKIFQVSSIGSVTKAGFGGDEKEVLRITCLVEVEDGVVVEKKFDNGTARFAQALIDAGVDVGSSFTITRQGDKEKTRYLLTDVVNKAAKAAPTPAAPAAGAKPAAPAPTPNAAK